MPLYTPWQPNRLITPRPLQASEGPHRYPHRVDRVGRLWALGQVLTFGVLIAAAAYTWSSWASGGWFAAAGWFVLIALMLVLVGWVVEHLGMGRIVRTYPERLTGRYIWTGL